MAEQQVPFDGDVVAGDARLPEGEHVVPMTVRDADGNLLATLGDVVVNVSRDEQGWVWDARLPGQIDPGLAEHLAAGRFAFRVPEEPDPPRLDLPAVVDDAVADATRDAWRRFRDA